MKYLKEGKNILIKFKVANNEFKQSYTNPIWFEVQTCSFLRAVFTAACTYITGPPFRPSLLPLLQRPVLSLLTERVCCTSELAWNSGFPYCSIIPSQVW